MQSYSLSELLGALQVVVRGAFSETYWVRAEISSLSAKPNSHCYMELAESAGAAQGGLKSAYGQEYAAKIKANCWRNVWVQVCRKFEDAVGQPLKVGMQVLAEVTVDFHPVYGMSLTVQQIDPSFTLGDLARQKAEALRKLEEEGIIDMQKELTLPLLPKRLAVISAATAAGYQDFDNQLKNNAQGYAFRTRLYPATMQGDTAAASIISALREIYKDEREYDAVVIIRGGGATTDLSCFDQYELAAHCAQFPLPIIAGIGHTRDVSLVDRVAYASVKTPTAAAELLISKMAEQDDALQALAERLRQTATHQIQIRRQLLDQTEMRIRLLTGQRLQKQLNTLDLLEKTIELHSPERIFRMGYSLTMKDGKVVRSAAGLKPGDRLTTAFADGQIASIVDSQE